MHWMILPYRRYFDFSGRSRRSEYWWFLVFEFIVAIVLVLGMFGTSFDIMRSLAESGTPPSFESFGVGFWVLGAILVLFSLFSFIPSLAVQVRRLHDFNLSGWWYLGYAIVSGGLSAIGEVGELVGNLMSLGWFVWMFFPGTRGPNKYGEDPKHPFNAEVFA